MVGGPTRVECGARDAVPCLAQRWRDPERDQRSELTTTSVRPRIDSMGALSYFPVNPHFVHNHSQANEPTRLICLMWGFDSVMQRW
jgi:hypothetical protein